MSNRERFPHEALRVKKMSASADKTPHKACELNFSPLVNNFLYVKFDDRGRVKTMKLS